MKNDFSFGVIPVYFKDNEPLFLVVKHRQGHWAFPKGHPLKDESEIETALRELREETGITHAELLNLPPIQESYDFEDNHTLIHKTVTYYVGRIDKPDFVIDEEEIVEAEWLRFEEASRRLTFEEGKRTLERAKMLLEER